MTKDLTESLNHGALYFQLHARVMYSTLQDAGRHGLISLNFANSNVVKAYKIGDTIWASARLTWQVAAYFQVSSKASSINEAKLPVDFEIATTLLMQLDPQGDIITAEAVSESQPFEIRRGEMIVIDRNWA